MNAALMPGELPALVERCRRDDAEAWETFALWVKWRGHRVLGAVGGLGSADREDAVAEALKSLVGVIRRGDIRGTSSAEIDAYVCAAVRHRALNVMRGRARRRAGELAGTPGQAASDSRKVGEALDEAPAQDAQAIAAEQLDRAEQLLLSWPPADRYLFLAKLNGVSARAIQSTLERPPFLSLAATATVDSRFHRLRKRLIEHIGEP